MLSYIMGQSPISNMGAGNGEHAFLEHQAHSSKCMTSQHDIRQHGWETPGEVSHPLGFLFTLNFINLGAPRC